MLRCFKKEAAKQNTVVEYKQPPASCDAATEPLIVLIDEAVENPYPNFRGEAAFQLTNELSEWLEKNDILPVYAEDFEAMGLKDRGHVLRLERCAQKLAPFNVTINQSSIELCDVGAWLQSLELQGYQQLFEAAGYKTRDDLENLKGLKRMQSEDGNHQERFEEGILRLSYLYDAKFRLMPEVVTWLEQHDCTDLEAIGIKDRGIAQHLEKAAKKLPMFFVEKRVPVRFG
eukprot:Em0369g9a